MTPKKLKMNPTELTVPKVPIFFIIKTIPFKAAPQKFLPVSAIYNKVKKLENKLT